MKTLTLAHVLKLDNAVYTKAETSNVSLLD